MGAPGPHWEAWRALRDEIIVPLEKEQFTVDPVVLTVRCPAERMPFRPVKGSRIDDYVGDDYASDDYLGDD